MRTKMSNPIDQPKVKDPSEEDYETQGHMRTLMDAEMLKQDPDKMKKVHALAGRHMKGIKSIQDLKDSYQSKFGPRKPKLGLTEPEEG